jgi:hypothetical protein
VRKSEKVWPLPLSGGALGLFAALMLAAPIAHADPDAPAPPPLPLPGEQSISTQAAAGDPALPPVGDPALVSAAGDPALPAPPPAEVPHLSSPENLPPGTSDVPLEPEQGRGTSYLRDLWHAVQTQDISGKDALLLLTQRPLDANAMPTNGMPTAPQAPPGTPLPLGPGPDAPPPDGPPPADGPPPGPALPGLVPPTPSP